MKSNLFFCNREDFVDVADLVLSSSPEDHVKAISKIAYWKCSMPNVPMPVLCTHSLLVIRSFHSSEQADDSFKVNSPPSSYIAEEFRNLAYASAVSRSISLLLEDNEDCQDLSMKDLASSLGLPTWLTDVRNEIAHGRRLLSIDFLSSVVDRVLVWLRESFWKDLLEKYSGFVRSGGNGSPLWLQLEELLVMYEQHTYRSLTISSSSITLMSSRRRIAIVRQLGGIAKLSLAEFCRCFVRTGYMFPTLEQLAFLAVDPQLIAFWQSGQNDPTPNLTLNKRINSAVWKIRKFWKMLIFHLSTSVPDAIPTIIEAVVKSFPTSPSLFDRQIRHECWLNYLVDKYVSRKPELGHIVMQKCAMVPSLSSLTVLRRLLFIEWPSRSDSVKCSNLVELISMYIGSKDSSYREASAKQVSEDATPFTVDDAENMIQQRKQ